MNTEGKIAVGVLAGLVAGAVFGVLFAPAKGSETRKMIAGRGKEALDGVKESLNEAREAVTSQLESAGSLVSEMASQITSKPESLKKETQHSLASNEKNHQNSVTNQNRH